MFSDFLTIRKKPKSLTNHKNTFNKLIDIAIPCSPINNVNFNFPYIKNIYSSGLKEPHGKIHHHNDTKRGWLVGIDDFGNKYYETDAPEEIHLRTRWVEYSQWNQDMSQVEPGWHYWLGLWY